MKKYMIDTKKFIFMEILSNEEICILKKIIFFIEKLQIP